MCKVTSKLFLTVISVVFWCIAAALVFIGCWVFATYHHYDELTKGTHILVPAIIMLGVGVFVFILGCVGCVGAFKEQKCLLGLFFTIILVIFVGIVSCAIMAYVFRGRVDSVLRTNLEAGLAHYNDTSSKYRHEMDYMQQNLKCCGVDNYTDWQMNTTFFHKPPHYPDSCCADNNCTITPKRNESTFLYHDGCYHKMKTQFVSHLGIIAGVTAAFAFIQLLGMISSCVLICRRKSEIPYIGLSEPSGMRV